MHQDLIEQLSYFGLTAVEAKVYLYLLNKQPKSVLEIARELRIPRTSVYDNAIRLEEKGLVQKLIHFKSQKLQAFPLNILKDRIEKERDKLVTLESNLISLEEHLKQTFIPPASTEVRYYKGREGFQQMMWNTLAAKHETIGYSEFGRRSVVGDKFMDSWLEEIIQRKIMDRVLTNPKKETLEFLMKYSEEQWRGKFQNTKVMPEERLYISGDTTIYNNTFAVCYWKQGEVVGVEIENPEYVRTQKSIFEELWRLADPIENYIKK